MRTSAALPQDELQRMSRGQLLQATNLLHAGYTKAQLAIETIAWKERVNALSRDEERQQWRTHCDQLERELLQSQATQGELFQRCKAMESEVQRLRSYFLLLDPSELSSGNEGHEHTPSLDVSGSDKDDSENVSGSPNEQSQRRQLVFALRLTLKEKEDQLLAAQADIIRLERTLRQAKPLKTSALEKDVEALEQQRTRDASHIKELHERAVKAEASVLVLTREVEELKRMDPEFRGDTPTDSEYFSTGSASRRANGSMDRLDETNRPQIPLAPTEGGGSSGDRRLLKSSNRRRSQTITTHPRQVVQNEGTQTDSLICGAIASPSAFESLYHDIRRLKTELAKSETERQSVVFINQGLRRSMTELEAVVQSRQQFLEESLVTQRKQLFRAVRSGGTIEIGVSNSSFVEKALPQTGGSFAMATQGTSVPSKQQQLSGSHRSLSEADLEDVEEVQRQAYEMLAGRGLPSPTK